ncbi:hypothetical protein INR49_018424 [Caranx melampygus]|nr:hypothetical protein INR49_018424 [Caranx melampygus]
MGQSTMPAMATLAHRNRAMPSYYASTASVYQPETESPAITTHQGVNSKNWLSSSNDSIGWKEASQSQNTDLEMRISMQNLSLEKPKKKTGKFTSSHLSTSASSGMEGSVQSIPDYVYSQLSNPHGTSPESKKLHQDICAVSQRVHSSLTSIYEVLSLERERLRQAWTGPDLRQNTSHQLATLCSTLSERTPSVGRHSQRAPSVAESMAEYFDASEVIICESSSEAEASDESGLSDITTTSTSEPEEGHATATLNYRASLNSASNKPSPIPTDTGRRTTLPAPGTDNSHIGIMTILYNNIGKDLSRVSMPVALNEPVSLLQRLSEELEYSDLLDIANHIDDPFERMVYVAAFSISGYAWASWRYRYKPFNPVLGETYESQREDRGFCYISEQVSHHPPISACYAESENFTFWQDNNKNEVQGVVLDQAGEVVHRFGGFWHEGIFCETLSTPKCIWKPNVQPDDHFQFYGFSHYARELNELTPDLKEVLPPTDTRFRPDQRLLEEGKVTEADKKKDEVEQKQRERRKEMTKRGEEHIPRFFRKAVDEAGREVWLYNGTYWRLRKDPDVLLDQICGTTLKGWSCDSSSGRYTSTKRGPVVDGKVL